MTTLNSSEFFADLSWFGHTLPTEIDLYLTIPRDYVGRLASPDLDFDYVFYLEDVVCEVDLDFLIYNRDFHNSMFLSINRTRDLFVGLVGGKTPPPKLFKGE